MRVGEVTAPEGYRLVGLLGRGSSGEVHEAIEIGTGEHVALKLLHRADPASEERFEREAIALGLLDVPGVVRLRRQGHHQGCPFLVMDLVRGAPFPGPLRGWAELREPVQRLLGSLSALHRAGVVHRDLKPSNVLLTPEGQPVILDLGLSRGRPLGSTITSTGAVLGTPRYLAPEQLQGRAVDGRADLYAVGVMLFEALTGQPPHPSEDWLELWRCRLLQPAPPLQSLLPTAPATWAAAIDALLARDPEQRPASADVAAELLGASQAPPPPWLGPRDALDALIDAARAGRSVSLWGPRGSGRTHHLQALARAVADTHPVEWLEPSTLPLGSVLAFLRELGDEASADPAVFVEEALAAHVASGGLVLADDWERVDPWSRELVDAQAARGGVIAVRPAPDAVQVPTLPQQALRDLFRGPERVLHLPSDAARLLQLRSGGTAGGVLRELGAWERLGHARRVGPRWELSRPDLEGLMTGVSHPTAVPCPADSARRLSTDERQLIDAVRLAWPHTRPETLSLIVGRPLWQVRLGVQPLVDRGLLSDEQGPLRLVLDPGWAEGPPSHRKQLHQAIAAALPADAPATLHHLLAAGGGPGLAQALQAELVRRWAAGSRLRAVRLAEQGLALLDDPPDALCTWLAQMGSLTDAASLSEAIEGLLAPRRPGLAQVVQAARKARVGQPCTVAVPPELAIVGWYLRWEEARRDGPAAEQALLDAAEAWAEGEHAAQVLGWRGLAAYRDGKPEQAMALHLRSAAQRHTEVGRLSSLLNAAAAALEAGRLDAAESAARQALGLASAGRHGHYEARAEWVLRSAYNRRGGDQPDHELLAAVEGVDYDFVRGAIRLGEAMVSLRGAHAGAAELATAAAHDFDRAGSRWGAVHAAAVGAHAQGGAPPDEQLADCPLPELVLDALALGASPGADLPARWKAQARGALAQIEVHTLHQRRGYFTPHDAAFRLGVLPDQPSS